MKDSITPAPEQPAARTIRSGSRRRQAFVILLIIVVATALGGYIARDFLKDAIVVTFLYDGSRADWELFQLRQRFMKGELQESDSAVRATCFEIARANPGSRTEMTAYLFVANQWPETADAEAAHDALLRASKMASMNDLAQSFLEVRPHAGQQWHALAAILIERVRQEPDHAKAARILCDAAVILERGEHLERAPDELLRIADLIQQRYSRSPELANFCEVVSNLGNPAGWTQPFEPYVRKILDVNQDRFVQCSAHFALAGIVRSGGIQRQEEARRLHQEFLAKFDGEKSYPGQSIEQANRQKSERILSMIAAHGLGMPAPETHGIDLDGESLSLEDYRGRVVLVSFWATWCAPCMKAIPRERDLLQRFGPSGFAIFGMNADDDLQKAKAAVREHEITWRSLRTRGDRASQTNHWTVLGYPTYYLLSKDLVIARSWLGNPPDSELIDAIRRLIDSDNDLGEPDGAANGSQPVRSETNSTSPAAGSRR